LSEVFVQEDQNTAHIAKGIRDIDQEPGVALDLEAGDEAVKEQTVEGNIADVHAKTGADHPQIGIQLPGLEEEGRYPHDQYPKDEQEMIGHKGLEIVLYKKYGPQDQEYHHGNDALRGGKDRGVPLKSDAVPE